MRIEKSLAFGLTQENPCLLAKQTNLSEANTHTKKLGLMAGVGLSFDIHHFEIEGLSFLTL